MEEVGFRSRIMGRYASMSAQEQKIADYFLANTSESVLKTIGEVAKGAGTGVSTVVRFARHLGYESYQQFRLSLMRENVINENLVFEVPVSKEADPVDVVIDSEIASLEATRKILDRDALKEAAHILARAKRIALMGLGGSNIIASNAYHKFIRLGLCCVYSPEFHTQLINASQLTADDAVLLFSHTGVDLDAVALKDEAKEQGAKVISISSINDALVGEGADIRIWICQHQETAVNEAFSSRLANMAVVDVLYLHLVEELDDSAEQALEKMRDSIAKRCI